jgi:NhaP-type Na+/H+ or K+/H+ antiporter
MLDYDEIFDWPNALMLGAILSATDPVAVVALLKEVGVSKRFSTLIEGESLLNDGTAMVIFEVFFAMARGEEQPPEEILVTFIRMALGGVLLGLAFAIGMS